MENRLDILTKKLYDEGVEKAQQEAAEILRKANEEAEKIVSIARDKVEQMQTEVRAEMEGLRKKAESEMALSARQALTALKQAIADLMAGEVAGEIARTGFEDKAFVQELLMTVVQKWDVTSGNLNMEVLLPEEEKTRFETFVAEKFKSLLDKGLGVRVGNTEGEFILQPKDGGYQIAFSEALFEAFFSQYMRGFTKKLLFKE